MVGRIAGGATAPIKLHQWELYDVKENPALKQFLWICKKCGTTTEQHLPLWVGCPEPPNGD